MGDDYASFVKRFHAAICSAFDLGELRLMVRLELGVRLDKVAPTGGKLLIVALELIEWAERDGRFKELVRSVAASKPERHDLQDLAKEYATDSGLPAKASAGRGKRRPLSAELVREIIQFKRIPSVIEEGPGRFTLMEQSAGRIRTLPLEGYDIPTRLHLSHDLGERLAAVIALERAPNPRYLRWLAERVVVEPAYVGYSAAVALNQAALEVGLPQLDRVRLAAGDALSFLSSASDRAGHRDQLQEAIRVTNRREGQVRQRVKVSFDRCATALSETFTVDEFEKMLLSGTGQELSLIVPPERGIHCCVYYVLEMATRAGWDHKLVEAARLAKPGPAALKLIFNAYLAAGLVADEGTLQ
jgi:hypothetical protein